MGNFNDFMFTKTLDRLAERCVRENLPIVEFVEWYIEEGQHLSEAGSFWGDVGRGAAVGGGYGAGAGVLSGIGAVPLGLGGAALGALYGGAKNIANRFGKGGYNTTKQAALDALQKFAALSPRHKANIDKMINDLAAIQPDGSDPAASGAPTSAKAGAPAASLPTATPASSWDIGMDNMKLQKAGIDPHKANAKGVTYAMYHQNVLKHLNAGQDASDAEAMAKKELQIEAALAAKYWARFLAENAKR